MNYYPLIRKIILICGDAACLYLATTAAMLLELGIKQSDKIAFHMQFLPILIVIMLVMFNVYGLFSLVRKRIAARMRANSKEANSSKSLAIMDVNQNAVVSAMEKHQVQWLIHGHTHRPAVHELIANQQPAFRVVLGAWHTEGSMVKVTADDVELIHFPF